MRRWQGSCSDRTKRWGSGSRRTGARGGLLVVGVVGDIGGGSATQPAPPAFYFPASANPQLDLGALIRAAGDSMAVLPAVRRIVEQLDPEVPIHGVGTLAEIAEERLGVRQMAMSLFGIFAGLALLLGAMGIHGMMSWSVAQRAGELGVRVAFAASRGSVLRLVFGQVVRLTAAGVVVGLLLALAFGPRHPEPALRGHGTRSVDVRGRRRRAGRGLPVGGRPARVPRGADRSSHEHRRGVGDPAGSDIRLAA